jgi:hypothetical protein
MELINLRFPTLGWSNLVSDAESANMLRRSLVARDLSARLIGETFVAMAVAISKLLKTNPTSGVGD